MSQNTHMYNEFKISFFDQHCSASDVLQKGPFSILAVLYEGKTLAKFQIISCDLSGATVFQTFWKKRRTYQKLS